MAVITSSEPRSLCSGLDIFFSVADTSLFVAKISFVMAEETCKEAVITSSLVKITVVVAEI